MTRASIINLLASPYIEMANLKGLSRSRIIVHHALPNALAPIINVIVINLAYLVVGVVIVEVVFVYPGLGQLFVDSVISSDLKIEGLAREVVRRIQSQRKDAGLNIEDRIQVHYALPGDPASVAKSELANVFSSWADYIRTETLTVELTAAQPPEEAYVDEHEIDGQALQVGITRA